MPVRRGGSGAPAAEASADGVDLAGTAGTGEHEQGVLDLDAYALAGKTFAELSIPEGCHPVALLRGNDVVMPGEGVRIQVDDALLVLAGPGGSCNIDSIG